MLLERMSRGDSDYRGYCQIRKPRFPEMTISMSTSNFGLDFDFLTVHAVFKLEQACCSQKNSIHCVSLLSITLTLPTMLLFSLSYCVFPNPQYIHQSGCQTAVSTPYSSCLLQSIHNRAAGQLCSLLSLLQLPTSIPPRSGCWTAMCRLLSNQHIHILYLLLDRAPKLRH